MTGKMPPPPPPADTPILVVETTHVAPAPAGEQVAKELPTTGTNLPLLGLWGLVSLSFSLGLRLLGKGRGVRLSRRMRLSASAYAGYYFR